jgi:crotonobetainyl-CoA:carnitine CoA-transferase CaiB-like acyl-CoA transferase
MHEALRQPRSSDILRRYNHPDAGPVSFFASPFRFDGERAAATPPPRLGEHSAEIGAGGFGAVRSAGDHRVA